MTNPATNPGGAEGRQGEGFSVSDEEIEWRKRFLEFSEDDARQLQSMHGLAQGYANEVIEGFYRHLLSFEEGRAIFQDPKLLERVRQAQKDYFLGLTSGEYGRGYVEDRLHVGAIHERIGLPAKLFLGMYNWYMRAVASRILKAYEKDPAAALSRFLSITKLLFLDIGLAIDIYMFQRERTIRRQQEAIRELSTPVLAVRERLLLLPVIGELDGARARQLTEQLLRALRAHRGKVAVLDLTGVPVVDSKVANHLIQTVEAARLLGSMVIITGLSPEIAHTLVTVGVDLSRVTTVGDLRGGLEMAEQMLGYRMVRSEGTRTT